MRESGTAVCGFWYYFSLRRNEKPPAPCNPPHTHTHPCPHPLVQAMGHFLMQYAVEQNTEQRRGSWCRMNSKAVSIDYTSLPPMIYGGKQLQRREWCPASVCHPKEHSVALTVTLSHCLWSHTRAPWGKRFEICLSDRASAHLGSETEG